MNFLKERVFTRASGIRHLIMLVLGVFVLAWSYVVVAVVAAEDWDWLRHIYRNVGNTVETKFFWAFVGLWIGLASALGALIYANGKKWMIRLFVRFLYSILCAIPIVNAVVPLLYRFYLKKRQVDVTSWGNGLGDSLKRVSYYSLIEENNVFESNGKLKFGLIRYLCVTVIQLIEGIVFLVGSLVIPVCTPLVMLLGMLILALVAELSLDAAFWIGAATAILSALVFVVHPVIALCMNKRQRGLAAQSLPDSGWMDDRDPEPGEEADDCADTPDAGDSPEPELPEPQAVPLSPETEQGSSLPAGATEEGEQLVQEQEWKEPMDPSAATTERGCAGEIENCKEVLF